MPGCVRLRRRAGAGRGCEVVVVGVSHVAASSLRHIAAAVGRARPDAVLVELCRERVGFLLDDGKDVGGGTRWAARPGAEGLAVRVFGGDGLPLNPAAAAAAATGPSEAYEKPFSAEDIRSAAERLLVGANGSKGGGEGRGGVRASLLPPAPSDMPAFFWQGGALVEAQPVAGVDFQMSPEARPPNASRQKVYGMYRYVHGDNAAQVAEAAERAGKRGGGGGAAETSRGGPLSSFALALSEYLTAAFAEGQAEAGAQGGIKRPGEAWRVAFEESAACGAHTLVLGDQRSEVTRVRMGELVLEKAAQEGLFQLVLASALVGAVAAAAVAATPGLPGGESAVVGLQVSGFLAGCLSTFLGVSYYYLTAPIREVKQFARENTQEEIEEVVAQDLELSEGISEGDTEGDRAYEPVIIAGEDAIVNWSAEAILDERDVFQATALRDLADGSPGALPGYTTALEDGSPASRDKVFRYRANLGQVPKPRVVVGVVGAAHLPGIIQTWEESGW